MITTTRRQRPAFYVLVTVLISAAVATAVDPTAVPALGLGFASGVMQMFVIVAAWFGHVGTVMIDVITDITHTIISLIS